MIFKNEDVGSEIIIYSSAVKFGEDIWVEKARMIELPF